MTRSDPPTLDAGPTDPRRFIERVSLVTGEVVDDAIDPAELLVHRHRDYHVVDIQARRVLSRMVASTGEPARARARMRRARRLGHRTSELLAKVTPGADSEAIARALFGLVRREHYFRYRSSVPRGDAARERLAALQAACRRQVERGRDEGRGLRVFLTGGTGFVGKEILWQAARDPAVESLWVLIRPKKGRSAAERGQELVQELRLPATAAAKLQFVSGNVTEPTFGLGESTILELAGTVSHLVHCAASVAFDDPYERSFEANVTGTLNALRLSDRLRRVPGSSFCAHLGIETAYIHGRRQRSTAREDELVFPRNFYNNYYELTKAMASLETERFMFERELPVVQLCPAIVIGDGGSGNNRGDIKVVNAPVNLFGRAQGALSSREGGLVHRSQAALLARLATIFPADPGAELNLIPVDWVARGIVAALKQPAAIGQRIHLVTDRRITAARMTEIVAEELGVRVRLSEPTLHRNVILPVLTRVLNQVGQRRLAHGLERLAGIFGNYGEWAQPIHQVAKDLEVLGLPAERPDTERAFRMLCRHNRWVQEFGAVRGGIEISRREAVWQRFLEALRARTGDDPAHLPGYVFTSAAEAAIERPGFELVPGALEAWEVPEPPPEPAAGLRLDGRGLATAALTGAVAAGVAAAVIHRARSDRRDADEKDPASEPAPEGASPERPPDDQAE